MRSRWAVRYSCGHDSTHFTEPGRSPAATVQPKIGAFCATCRSEVAIAHATYVGDEEDDGPVRLVSTLWPRWLNRRQE